MRNLSLQAIKFITALVMQFWLCAPAAALTTVSVGESASDLLSGTFGILVTLSFIVIAVVSATVGNQRLALVSLLTMVMATALPGLEKTVGAHVAGVSLLLFFVAVAAFLASSWYMRTNQTASSGRDDIEQRIAEVDRLIAETAVAANQISTSPRRTVPLIPEIEQPDAREASANTADPKPERNKRKIVLL